MLVGRMRSIGLATAALAIAMAVLVPATSSTTTADAAGEAYEVHSWTDPKGKTHRVRWNPCQTITYAVNLRLAGGTTAARDRALKDVQGAFHRASKRTGLTFKYKGRTTELPRNAANESWSSRQKAAEIVVAWVNQSRDKYRTNLLTNSGSGYPSGVGGWMLRGWTNDRGNWEAAVGRGFVVINAAQRSRYKEGFGSGVTRGALLLHELGHALGLDHVGSTNQLMYPTMLRREHSNYKAGDERGLSKVGRRLGCIPGANSAWPQI